MHFLCILPYRYQAKLFEDLSGCIMDLLEVAVGVGGEKRARGSFYSEG